MFTDIFIDEISILNLTHSMGWIIAILFGSDGGVGRLSFLRLYVSGMLWVWELSL